MKKIKRHFNETVGYHFENNKKPLTKGTVKKIFLNSFYKTRRWQLF